MPYQIPIMDNQINQRMVAAQSNSEQPEHQQNVVGSSNSEPNNASSRNAERRRRARERRNGNFNNNPDGGENQEEDEEGSDYVDENFEFDETDEFWEINRNPTHEMNCNVNYIKQIDQKCLHLNH